MSSRAAATTAAAVALSLVTSDCYKDLPFNNYGLRLPQGGTVGEIRAGGRAVVRFGDMSAKVDAVDIGGMSMILVVVFASDKGMYTFNPMEVALDTGSGVMLQPTWYLGPGRLRRLHRDERACLPLTSGTTRSQEWLGKSADGLPQLTRQTKAAQHPLLGSDTCFVLRYGARVTAPSRAAVTFSGIRHRGAAVRGARLLIGAEPMYGRVLSVTQAP